MNYLSAKQLSRIVSSKHRLTQRESRQIIDLVFSTIADGFKNGKETWIPMFGRFCAVYKPEGRIVWNAREGRMMVGRAKIVPRVRWSGQLFQ